MYSPGSFTKNLGWSRTGQGLQALHTTINNAFSKKTLITREEFRDECGIPSPDRQLIVLNFFMHNTAVDAVNYVTFDQLARKALTEPHSWSFDQLALFALHLAEMGVRAGQGGNASGAMFTNEYVRNVLWQGGAWRRKKLTEAEIKASFNANIVAAPGSDTIHKCFTNYRYILELCGVTQGKDEVINTNYEKWCEDALYLFFDRVPRPPVCPEALLIQLVYDYEVHKLLGTTEAALRVVLRAIAYRYTAAGGLNRASSGMALPVPGQPNAAIPGPNPAPGAVPPPPGPGPSVGTGGTPPQPVKPPSTDETEELLYVARRFREVQAQIRNPANVRYLKQLYENNCAFCGKQTIGGLDPTSYYSEAAHIQPVGDPHRGPDVIGNMLLLCSEHHLQFDRGLHTISFEDGRVIVESRIPDSPISGREIALKPPHNIGESYIAYHRRSWHFD